MDHRQVRHPRERQSPIPLKFLAGARASATHLKLSLHDYYNTSCSHCGQTQKELAAITPTEKNKLTGAFNKAIQWIHASEKSDFTPDDITHQEVQPLLQELNNVLQQAVQSGIAYKIPERMQQHFKDNVYVFSGCKTYAQLKEVSSFLLDDQGKPKPFSQFKKQVQGIYNNYNKNYLESEYLFANATARMASKWEEFLQDGDRYNIQYRTAGDSKVRDSHASLEGITLPPSDPFWNSYLPKNGWRCRCDVVQVRTTKYPVTPSDQAASEGAKATTTINKKGVNTSEMFRFNAHQQQVIFPPTHPYFNNKAVVDTIQAQQTPTLNLKELIKGDVPTNSEMKKILHAYAELYPDDFRNGLEAVKFSKARSFFMQHSMMYKSSGEEWVGGSTITISTNPFRQFTPSEELKNAFAAIKKGEPLSFNQEYSIESLWHEILHAKTKSKPAKRNQTQTETMETLNQFCARHTYVDFLERIGGKATHQDQVLSDGYGYNAKVSAFRKKMNEAKIDEKKAVEELMPKLLDDYGNLSSEINKFIAKNTTQESLHHQIQEYILDGDQESMPKSGKHPVHGLPKG